MKSNLELMQNVVKPYIDAKNQALTNEVRGNWATGGVNLFNPKATILQNNAYGFFKVYDNDAELTITLIDKKPAVTLTDIGFGFSYALTAGGQQSEISAGFTWIYTNNAPTGKTNNYDSSHLKYCGQFCFYPNTQAALDAIVDKYDIQIEVGSTATPYQPYAKTNVELTQDVAEIEGLLANAVGKEITAATAWSDLENMGTYVMNGAPFTGSWSIVLVLKRNENTGVQIAFRVGSASDVSSSYVAYRMYYTGTWSSWAVVNATNQT